MGRTGPNSTLNESGGPDNNARCWQAALLFCVYLAVEKVFAYRREDVYEDHLLIHHRSAMPAFWRKVQDIARRGDAFLTFNKKPQAPALNNRHLLMWVIMFRSHQKRREAKTADHHVLLGLVLLQRQRRAML